MITASHNPKTITALKFMTIQVQLTPEKVDLLIAELKTLPDYLDIKIDDKVNGYILLSDDVELTYYSKVMKIQLRRDLPKKTLKLSFHRSMARGENLECGRLMLFGYNVILLRTNGTRPEFFRHKKS